MKCLVGVSFLLVCSPLLAVPPPEEEGWRKLDFVCVTIETGERTYPFFYVSQQESDWWEENLTDGTPRYRHSSEKNYLEQNYYNLDGEIRSSSWIDRSTGHMTKWDYGANLYFTFDCELRAENKF